ncbi:MAG: hypothetical protein RSC20_00570 [Clostridiales bacterium]
MEKIIAKIKEYLAMDSEIEFKEFEDYYKTLIEKLNKDFKELKEEELLQMRYVLNTVTINAENRAARKDKYMKKFRKIADKTKFWAEAIAHKLKKELGYTDAAIEEADERIDGELRPNEETNENLDGETSPKE